MDSSSSFYQDEDGASNDRYSGIRTLWAKVIQRAAFDWVTYRYSQKLALRKYADNAYAWIFEPSTLFNSFANACHYAGADPDQVRESIKNMKAEDVSKVEYTDRTKAIEVRPRRLELNGSR